MFQGTWLARCDQSTPVYRTVQRSCLQPRPFHVSLQTIFPDKFVILKAKGLILANDLWTVWELIQMKIRVVTSIKTAFENYALKITGLILGLRPANKRCNAISHWLYANLESALNYIFLRASANWFYLMLLFQLLWSWFWAQVLLWWVDAVSVVSCGGVADGL